MDLGVMPALGPRCGPIVAVFEPYPPWRTVPGVPVRLLHAGCLPRRACSRSRSLAVQAVASGGVPCAHELNRTTEKKNFNSTKTLDGGSTRRH